MTWCCLGHTPIVVCPVSPQDVATDGSDTLDVPPLH